MATRVPSASGTRAYSPCPPSTRRPSRSVLPQKPPVAHADWMPARQCGQVLSEYMNGATTKSPGRTVVTSAPTSSTRPTNSWPIRAGSGTSLMPR